MMCPARQPQTLAYNSYISSRLNRCLTYSWHTHQCSDLPAQGTLRAAPVEGAPRDARALARGVDAQRRHRQARHRDAQALAVRQQRRDAGAQVPARAHDRDFKGKITSCGGHITHATPVGASRGHNVTASVVAAGLLDNVEDNNVRYSPVG